MILHINVARRVATYQKRDGAMVCGNNDYQIKFTFDSEWDAYTTKTARFKWKGGWHDQTFDGDTCPVPRILGATEVKVGVYVDEFTTTDAVIPALCSCRCNEGELVQPGETYVNQAAAAVYAAQQAAERAEEAAENIEGLEEVDERLDDLEDAVADLNYTPITASLSVNQGTKELGSSVTGAVLSWSVSKETKSITLDGVAVDGKTSYTDPNTYTTTKTWTLRATEADAKGHTATAYASISFLNGVYYGVSSNGSIDTEDSADILAFTKKLRSSKYPEFTVTAGDGEYIYYCLPSRMGACTFTVGVLSGGFTLQSEGSFTNASGYTERYYIYRSNNPGLGSVTVKVT